MARRIVGVVAAVLLAAVGTLVLVGFVRGAETRALAGEETVEVLVVTEEVARNTPAADLAAVVETELVPAKVRAADAVSDIGDLEERVTSVALVPGEQLVAARFVTPTQLAQEGGVEVPEGLQEVSISLEPQRAVGGGVVPGDVVGVLASFVWEDDPKHTTKMNHAQVLVTNVQIDPAAVATAPPADDDTETTGPAAAPGGNLLITLAVDIEQAERIVFAAEHGTVWLTAQNDATSKDGSAVRDGGNIYDD
jgi:pilus assembly protein CpaB